MKTISNIFILLMISSNVFATNLEITDGWMPISTEIGKSTSIAMKISDKAKDDNLSVPDLNITDAWASATGGVGKNAAVYLKISNRGEDDKLMVIKIDIAKGAKPQVVNINDLVIPVGKTVDLEKNGT